MTSANQKPEAINARRSRRWLQRGVRPTSSHVLNNLQRTIEIKPTSNGTNAIMVYKFKGRNASFKSAMHATQPERKTATKHTTSRTHLRPCSRENGIKQAVIPTNQESSHKTQNFTTISGMCIKHPSWPNDPKLSHADRQVTPQAR